MQLGSSKDSFPCFTRLNPCVAHCSTDSILWVHHSREEGSLDYNWGFVRLQIHMNFDMNIHRQQMFRNNWACKDPYPCLYVLIVPLKVRVRMSLLIEFN
jgi:hypothetical protein